MKPNHPKFTQQYIGALRRYLQVAPKAAMHALTRLGHAALDLKLTTLDLAAIHRDALVALQLGEESRIVTRVEHFFSEVMAPIVGTHRAAQESQVRVSLLEETLQRRTEELAACNQRSRRDVAQRKSVEAALKKSNAHYTKLLQESLHLQDGLRQLTHKLLGAQEDRFQKASGKMQKEVTQNLVGANVRLLTLKRQSKVNASGIKKEIATTQKMVAKSGNSVRQAARKLTSI